MREILISSSLIKGTLELFGVMTQSNGFPSGKIHGGLLLASSIDHSGVSKGNIEIGQKMPTQTKCCWECGYILMKSGVRIDGHSLAVRNVQLCYSWFTSFSFCLCRFDLLEFDRYNAKNTYVHANYDFAWVFLTLSQSCEAIWSRVINHHHQHHHHMLGQSYPTTNVQETQCRITFAGLFCTIRSNAFKDTDSNIEVLRHKC